MAFPGTMTHSRVCDAKCGVWSFVFAQDDALQKAIPTYEKADLPEEPRVRRYQMYFTLINLKERQNYRMKKYYIYCKNLKTGAVTCSMFSYLTAIAESLKSQMALTMPDCEFWLEEDRGS